MSYKNPTLEEIYISLPFGESKLSESDFFTLVPALKNLGLTEIEMRQELLIPADNVDNVNIPFSLPKVRCWNEEKTKLVQLTPNKIVVNQTKEYLGWNEFKKLIQQTLNTLNELGLDQIYDSLDLNTIDKFSVNKKSFKLGDWLNCNGAVVPKWYEAVHDSMDFTLGCGFLDKDGYNRVFKIKTRVFDEHVEIRIENKFHNKLDDADKLFDTLEELHQESNEIFEDMITDKVRNEIMKGKA